MRAEVAEVIRTEVTQADLEASLKSSITKADDDVAARATARNSTFLRTARFSFVA